MSKNAALYVVEMIDAIERIEVATAGLTFDEFVEDPILKWAVERGIEIISEASRRIPEDQKLLFDAIDWRQIAGIGNVLRHDYRTVSHRVLWNVIDEHFEPLATALEKILANLEAE